MNRNEGIDSSAQKSLRTLSRREFVRKLSATAGGAGLLTAAFTGCALTPSQKAEAREAVLDTIGKVPKVKLNKRLGGFEASRVTICQDCPVDLIGPALAAGMNTIHKGGYWSRSQTPDEILKLPRESLFIDTTVDNTPRNPDDEESAYNQVTRELERTGLKYFDVFRAHFGWHTLAQFNKGQNASYRAFQRLKKEGKVKYFGVSQHAGPREDYETYMTMIQAEIDSGLIDTMQVWLSYASTPEELAIFEKAHKAGIAITAMKVNAHGAGKLAQNEAKIKELKSEGLVHRAALRYVYDLKGADGKPYVDMCVTRLGNFAHFEENVGSVAAKVAMADGFKPYVA